jgi:hypothetical protein
MTVRRAQHGAPGPDTAHHSKALVQSLIENLVREDMQPLDVARGLQALKEMMGWSNMEMARKTGVLSHDSINNYLNLLDEEPDIQKMVNSGLQYNKRATNEMTTPSSETPRAALSPFHVRQARESGLSPADRAMCCAKPPAKTCPPFRQGRSL